ncbi:MAG: ABC transporter ATP-binding protein [Planctomycetota bacterium]|nr:ABC transporter ATP-binding protein [Planctomycetota bacterium]
MIDVKDVGVSFGDRRVLDGITLQVTRGEAVAILGPSGCGKSTLLRLMIGLLPITQGTISILGEQIGSLSGLDLEKLLLRFGVLFQSSALIGSLTVGENVALPLTEHTALSDSAIDVVVRMKLAQVGLAHAKDLRPAQLSGGMAKRAGLARALALSPELLFFDEPSAGLDPLTALSLDHLIVDLRDRLGVTIVAVTHELASVRVFADRVIMLRDGKVAAHGTLDEVAKSDDPWVGNFLNRTAPREETNHQEWARLLAANDVAGKDGGALGNA